MNANTISYLAVTIATLVFCAILLIFTPDASTRYAATIMAGLAVGHWFGYSNQLVSSLPVPLPTQEPTKPA